MLWISTLNGVSRFDGNQLSTFQSYREGPGFLESSDIVKIIEDGKGNIFAVTRDAGLVVYNETSRSFSRIHKLKENEAGGFRVSTAFYDGNGNIWIGYESGMITRFVPRLNLVRNYGGLTSNRVSSFTTSLEGIVFAGSSEGKVFMFEDGLSNPTELDLTTDCMIKLSNLMELSIIYDNKLLVGTKGGGLYSISLGKPDCSAINLPGLDETKSTLSNINDIFFDRSKKLVWVATDQGLYRISQHKELLHYHTGNSNLANDEVVSISLGGRGVYWVGTFSGLNYLIPTEIQSFGKKYSTELHSIVSIGSSEKYGVWVATYNNLFQLDLINLRHNAITNRDKMSGFSREKIMTLYVDDEAVWVGYRASGLEYYSNTENGVRRYGTKEKRKLSSDSISAILTASNSETFIGTHGGGLNSLIDGKISKFQALPKSRVILLHETSDGTIWIGTESGFFQLDPKTNRLVEVKLNRLPHSPKTNPLIWAMAESARGDVWLGTLHHGLLFWPKEARLELNTSLIRRASRLPPDINTIYALQIDDANFVWCSTNNGLIRVNPETREADMVSVHQGLYDTEFDFGVSHKDRHGYLYFGGSSGYSRFDPDKVNFSLDPPNLKLTEIYSAGVGQARESQADIGGSLKLTHNNYLVTFTFSVLDFLDPEKNQFRYKLEGFDPNWIENGTRNTATYTNLPAGKYVLRVQGANASGVWNREGIALNVEVAPAPWWSWWAICCYILLLAAAGWMGKRAYDSYSIERRAIQLAQEKHDAENRADDDMQEQLEIQDELVKSAYRHNVATLALVNEMISRQGHYLVDEKAQAAIQGNMKRISALSLLENFLFYQADSLLANLHKFVEALVAELLKEAPIERESVTTINEITSRLIPVSLASPLAIVMYELLENSIYHAFEADSDSNYIHLSLRISDTDTPGRSQYDLAVSDNGKGIPEDVTVQTIEGSGLEIVHSIADDLAGTLATASESGTTVTLSFIQ